MTELYIVEGSDGMHLPIGPRQMHWLEQGGFVKRTEETDSTGIWHACHGLSAEDAHKLVMSRPELRECDFCRASPAGWRIHCRPFNLELGPFAGGRLGGPDRPLFACEVCVRYVRENRKQALIEYAIASTVEKARSMGGYLQQVAETQPWPHIKKHLTPAVREVVYGMFAHRIGWPERDDESEAA